MNNPSQTDFWLGRWKENRIGFHQSQVNPWLARYFAELQLHPGDAVFVPLCGKSLDMIWIASQGMRTIGVEVSPQAVEAFFLENNLQAERSEHDAMTIVRSGPHVIYVGDFFDLAPNDLAGVAAAYDRAAIVALPPEIRSRYATHLGDLLSPGSRLLLLSFEYPEGLRQGPPYSVTEDEIRTLFAPAFSVRRLAHNKNGPGDMQEKVFLLERRFE